MTDSAQDGRNHHRIEIAKSLSATGRSLATSNQDIKRQDDEPGEDSSSATSVVTCPDGEFPRHTQAQGTSNIGSSRTADASTEEAYKGRGSFAEAKESQPGNGKSVDIQDMPPSTSDSKTPDHGKNRRVSWLQWWRHTIFRRTHQASSDSSNNNKVPSETGPLLDLDSSSPQATDCPNDPSPAARARASNKTRKADRTTKALKTTNELGHKNLAELYARFDEAYVEELQVDLSEVDARKVRDQDLAHSTSTQSSNQAFEDMKKMQCQFCELYFTPEENVRDLDNGSSPCSHHPGKT